LIGIDRAVISVNVFIPNEFKPSYAIIDDDGSHITHLCLVSVDIQVRIFKHHECGITLTSLMLGQHWYTSISFKHHEYGITLHSTVLGQDGNNSTKIQVS